MRFILTVALFAATLGTAAPSFAQSPKVVLPPKGFVADAARGAQLFKKKCAACHGQDGRGTPQGPPLLHPGYRPDHHSDQAFYLAMQQGTRQHHWNFGDMKPLPEITPQDAAHIIAWVRREQRRAGALR